MMVRTTALICLLAAAPAAAFAQNSGRQTSDLNVTLQAPNEACAGGDWMLSSCTLGSHRAALAAVERRKLNETVGRLIADGKCDDAKNSALRAGNFDLAQQVNAFCKTPASPQ